MEYFNSFFEPKFQMKPSTTVSIMRVGQRIVTSDKCFLCNAYPTTDHLRSAKHKAKEDEMAAGDEQIGIAVSMRRFAPTLGLCQPLTQKSFREYWGRGGGLFDGNAPH